MAYIIDPDLCSNCGTCLDECRIGAVTRNDLNHPMIDPGTCTDCGTCADICPEMAIRGS